MVEPDRDPPSDADTRAMLHCVRLAEEGVGRVEPNPPVGCVLLSPDGLALAQGFHKRFGGPHAERVALAKAAELGVSVRGATAVVSLEPCSHHGKTPPCADALIEAGIARVVIPFCDPDPRVTGNGVRRLRAAGVRVDVLPRSSATIEAAELLQPWLHRLATGRPWLIAKWAQSIDGRLSTPSGDSQWLTGSESRRAAHELRTRCDAVLVGGETLRRDNPSLLPREVGIRRVPTRVAVSASLDVPTDCQLWRTARQHPVELWTLSRWRSVSPSELPPGAKAAMEAGVTLRTPRMDDDASTLTRERWLDLLAQVGDSARGGDAWTRVLVEGGGRLHGSLLDADLIDAVDVFIAPMIVGGHGSDVGRGLAMAGAGRSRLADVWRLARGGEAQRLDRPGEDERSAIAATSDTHIHGVLRPLVIPPVPPGLAESP